MALSGLDIYKLLPKTNCRECGFATCLAFAMQLAKKAVGIDKCPYVTPVAKKTLAESSLPPIKGITLGTAPDAFEIGNETVMFRHEEKFRNPCGLGFIIDDTLSDAQINARIDKINTFRFERVGQLLSTNVIAVRQQGANDRFAEAAKLVADRTTTGIVLIPRDAVSLAQALPGLKGKKPVIYRVTKDTFATYVTLAKEHKLPLVASAPDLGELSALTQELSAAGISEIILDTQKKPVVETLSNLTQARRAALKKSNRALGYPMITIVEHTDPYEETIEAATYITKYAGIVLISTVEPAHVLSLLTLRQNIYTDPQKPLQVEPKLYAVGQVSGASPVLVTTNFSLSYYTVLGEVEASKMPAYIASVDTEGMSVLTAWAAEKFTPEKIALALDKMNLRDHISHKNLIIPGYVAMMSGDLEEQSGLKIIVGPKEAAGIPSFLKNL